MSVAIDVHTHLAPVAAALTDPGVTVDAERIVIDGQTVGVADLYRPAALVDYLDHAGFASAWVSAPPPFYRQDQAADRCAQWVQDVHAGLVEACAQSGRLRPIAYLPLEHPEVAIERYQAVRHQNTVVTAAAGGGSVRLDDAALAPLWQAMNADQGVLLLHPGSTPDHRLAAHYQENLTGNPTETAIALSQLIFGNVLSAHQQLRIVTVHCAGTMPMLAGRWQRGIDTKRPGLPEPAVDLPAALRQIWFDSIAHDPAAMALAVQVLGADRLVPGSDWPFPMGSGDPLADIAACDATLVQQAIDTVAQLATA